MNRSSSPIRIVSALSLTTLLGCSAAAPESPERTAQATEPLLTNAENVTDTPGDITDQAETSSVVSVDGTEYIGYNAANSGFTFFNDTWNGSFNENREVCPGASFGGYATRSPGAAGWSMHWMSPPSGYAVLWGDPAMATLGQTVFLSSLAVPNDRFQNFTNNTFNGQSCIQYTSVRPGFPHGSDETMFAGACIARGASPGTLGNAQCLRIGNDFFDGGHMSASANFMYVAYNDVTSGMPVVFQATETGSFVQLPPPPIAVGAIADHPLLAAGGSGFYMLVPVAVDGFTLSLEILTFSETTNSWSPTVVSVGQPTQTQGRLSDNQTSLRYLGYDFKYIPAVQAPGHLYVATTRPMAGLAEGTQTQVAAYVCDTVGFPPLSCSSQPFYVSDANSFQPAIVASWLQTFEPAVPGPNFEIYPVISHWTESTTTPGTVRMRFNVDGINFWAPTNFQHPCPQSADGYWGDYDTAHMRANGSVRPTLIRAASDSTDGCRQSTDFTPGVHVSAIPLGFSNPIAIPSNFNGAIGVGEQIRYMIPVQGGQPYAVTLTPSTPDSNPDLYMNYTTVDFQGGLVQTGLAAADCASTHAAGTVDKCTFTAPRDGVAYIVVYGAGSARGLAGFKLQAIQTIRLPPFPLGGLAP